MTRNFEPSECLLQLIDACEPEFLVHIISKNTKKHKIEKWLLKLIAQLNRKKGTQKTFMNGVSWASCEWVQGKWKGCFVVISRVRSVSQ